MKNGIKPEVTESSSLTHEQCVDLLIEITPEPPPLSSEDQAALDALGTPQELVARIRAEVGQSTSPPS